MDLRGFLRLLVANREWIAISTAIGVITMMAFVLATPPKFVARSEMFLATPGYSAVGAYSTVDSSPYQADGFSQQRARTYVKLATRVDLARRVVDQLGIDMRPEELARSVSASVQPDTVLIDVTVTSTSATDAKFLADAVIAELASDIRKLETPSGMRISSVDPVITQPADIPSQPAEPKIWVLWVLGFSIGLGLGITAAAVRARRSVVHGSAGVIESTGRLPLAIEGISDVAPTPWSTAARRLELELQSVENPVIAVMPADSASAGSTVASRLAAALREDGKRVVVISLTASGAPEPAAHSQARGLAAVFAGDIDLIAALHFDQKDSVYWLLGAEAEVLDPMHSEHFRGVLGELRESFDLVILSDMPSPPHFTSTAADGSIDGVVVVMTDGTTLRHDVGAVMAQLRLSGVPVLGGVLQSSKSPIRSSMTDSPEAHLGGLTK